MDNRLIEQLWREHKVAAFPQSYYGKDVNGVDLVMLDADVAGCVQTLLDRGNLNLFQTAVLGLCYRNLSCSVPMLSDEGKEYYRRLELLAELVLKAVATRNQKNHEAVSADS
jgi:hypothetical protein